MSTHDGILVTGATGALGPALLNELLATNRRVSVLVRPGRQRDLDERLNIIEGDITDRASIELPLKDRATITTIIHAAADTRFRAPLDEQERTNIDGTRNLLQLAQRLPNLTRFVFVSTTCVAGTRTGSIPETVTTTPPEFLNGYEVTKWHAEQLVQSSGLPAIIVRLSTAIASERSARITRPGAIHHALRWLHRGLVPLLPGSPDTTIDLISEEQAAAAIVRAATATHAKLPACIHVAAGANAVKLQDLLDFVIEHFKHTTPAWRTGQIGPPLIVDAATFQMFQKSIRDSKDVLFKRVMDSTAAFLPGLLCPKIFQTTSAAALFGRPFPPPDWRRLLTNVIDQCIEEPEACHA